MEMPAWSNFSFSFCFPFCSSNTQKEQNNIPYPTSTQAPEGDAERRDTARISSLEQESYIAEKHPLPENVSFGARTDTLDLCSEAQNIQGESDTSKPASDINRNTSYKGTASILPNELIHQILLYVDTPSLIALSSVNHTFQSASERILYRNIGPTKPTRTIRCLKTLVIRPALATHIRSYEVGDLEDDSEPLPAFFKLLTKALHNMTRLTELTILLDGPYSDVLVGCPFRLTKLTSALHWNRKFTQWIQEQPELLIALFCGRYVVGTQVDSRALPKLTRISASPLILAAVVPGRPVKEVEICLVHPWLLNEGLMTTTMKIMTFSTGPLNSLQIISHFGESSGDVLAAVGVIPRIVSKLDSLAIHAVSGSVTADILAGLFYIISGFSSLRSVMILSKNIADDLHSAAHTRDLAAKWHGGCNTLDCVSFPEATWVKNKDYGWLTLKDLEKILAERERALIDREREIQDREKALGEEHRALEAEEKRLESQIKKLGWERE